MSTAKRPKYKLFKKPIKKGPVPNRSFRWALGQMLLPELAEVVMEYTESPIRPKSLPEDLLDDLHEVPNDGDEDEIREYLMYKLVRSADIREIVGDMLEIELEHIDHPFLEINTNAFLNHFMKQDELVQDYMEDLQSASCGRPLTRRSFYQWSQGIIEMPGSNLYTTMRHCLKLAFYR